MLVKLDKAYLSRYWCLFLELDLKVNAWWRSERLASKQFRMENELAEVSKFHPRRLKVHLLKYEITINSNEKTNIRNIANFL